MKRLSLVAFCILGFILITAPTAVEFFPVYLNGKLLGSARNINGIIAVSVADLARSSGGTLTLEDAGLTISGNTLSTVNPSNLIKKATVDDKHKVQTYKESPAIKGEIKMTSPALFRVNKAGAITTHLLTTSDGQKWVSVADFASAGGDGWRQPANLKPGEAIHLNFGKIQTRYVLIGL